MKICVYAIAKNEEQFVDRWVDSMSEADWVCVLDTGSTDRTVEKLADRGGVAPVRGLQRHTDPGERRAGGGDRCGGFV